ncbi:MAG: putative sugar nucleotidyl transferase [Saprospiraceae bacterium]
MSIPQNIHVENIVLFDDPIWQQLLPLTFTRPISEIRIGILTIREKWMYELKSNVSPQTVPYLSNKYPMVVKQNNLFINASYLPTKPLIQQILSLKLGEVLCFGASIVALKLEEGKVSSFDQNFDLKGLDRIELVQRDQNILRIERPWHILAMIQSELINDFDRIMHKRVGEKLSETNRTIGNHVVFAESGVKAECVIFNTTNGPIYLGKNSEVMEGSTIRGPFALGEGSTVNMGAKIYGPTAVGPSCKVGGEIKGSQFFGNGNKGHDGFLGDSIIGEWCNLGADTNSSNLKNNYQPVRVWSYVEEKFIDSGLQFCGLIMGDHSKCGINTMFNTGTVVGAYCNIFGEGYPRTFIPSFSWGGASGFQTAPIKKMLETAEIVMLRRKVTLTDDDKDIAQEIFERTKKYRAKEG